MGFLGLFPELKQVRSPPRVRVRECTGTRAHPRRGQMARTLRLMTAFPSMGSTKLMLAVCGAWSFVMATSTGGTLTLSIPSGTILGRAEVVV